MTPPTFRVGDEVWVHPYGNKTIRWRSRVSAREWRNDFGDHGMWIYTVDDRDFGGEVGLGSGALTLISAVDRLADCIREEET